MCVECVCTCARVCNCVNEQYVDKLGVGKLLNVFISFTFLIPYRLDEFFLRKQKKIAFLIH